MGANAVYVCVCVLHAPLTQCPSHVCVIALVLQTFVFNVRFGARTPMHLGLCMAAKQGLGYPRSPAFHDARVLHVALDQEASDGGLGREALEPRDDLSSAGSGMRTGTPRYMYGGPFFPYYQISGVLFLFESVLNFGPSGVTYWSVLPTNIRVLPNSRGGHRTILNLGHFPSGTLIWDSPSPQGVLGPFPAAWFSAATSETCFSRSSEARSRRRPMRKRGGCRRRGGTCTKSPWATSLPSARTSPQPNTEKSLRHGSSSSTTLLRRAVARAWMLGES